MNKPKASPLPGRLPAQQLRQHGSVQPSRPVVAQPGKASSTPTTKHPVAPPVYRPQPRPVALQTKAASPKQQPPSSQSRHSPVAPPVYRPAQNKSVQPKIAGTPPQAITGQTKRTPKAPAVYRPQPVPRVLQSKEAATAQPQAGRSGKMPVAPPAYRPLPVPRVLQSKQANARPAPGQQPSTPAHRPQQIPKVAQARTLPGQKPAEKLRNPSAPGPVMARHLPQTHGSNIQCHPNGANGLQPPKQPLTSRSIAAQARYTIQMVPIKVGKVTFDTNNQRDTDELESRLNSMFRNNPNSHELEYIYRHIDARDSEDEDEYERTMFIKETLLGGMLNTDSGYKEQIRTIATSEWQSASSRIYVDGRELDVLSWRHFGKPGGELDYSEKREKAKQEAQSAKMDDEGFQRKVGKHEKRDIQVSVEDAESKLISKLESAMTTKAFLDGLHAARNEVYIRIVSFLGACDACKNRITRLLQTIRAEVPAGVVVSLSFFYQVPPKQKVRGRGVYTTYGWKGDVEATQRGFGGLFIHDYPTVVGTWVAPVVVSNSASSSSSVAVVAKK